MYYNKSSNIISYHHTSKGERNSQPNTKVSHVSVMYPPIHEFWDPMPRFRQIAGYKELSSPLWFLNKGLVEAWISCGGGIQEVGPLDSHGIVMVFFLTNER